MVAIKTYCRCMYLPSLWCFNVCFKTIIIWFIFHKGSYQRFVLHWRKVLKRKRTETVLTLFPESSIPRGKILATSLRKLSWNETLVKCEAIYNKTALIRTNCCGPLVTGLKGWPYYTGVSRKAVFHCIPSKVTVFLFFKMAASEGVLLTWEHWVLRMCWDIRQWYHTVLLMRRWERMGKAWQRLRHAG